MILEQFAVGPLETNCYHVICDSSNQSVLIDPGGVSDTLIRAVQERDLKALLLTPVHFDHLGGARQIAELTGAPIMIHTLEASYLSDSQANGSALFGTKLPPMKPDRLLSAGDSITFGECSLKILHTPGHTPGGVSFITVDDQAAFVGDVLFRLSVGRWDLPGGDYRTLLHTLRTVFIHMPDATVVYPGHGESTTIGFEKKHNQFMMD